MNLTPAQWVTYWAAIKNPLPGGEAFHGEYWWLNRVGSAGAPTGTIAVHDAGAATFGAVLEHDAQNLPPRRCAVEIIATNRTGDRGFTGSNVIEVDGFRDLIVCPLCGLTGAIRGKAWTAV